MCEVGGSVLLETSRGDIVIDLYTKDCPKTCENFIKLCKIKYYNGCLFHHVEKDFIAETGRVGESGGSSIWHQIDPSAKKYFDDELRPQQRRKKRLSHNRRGIVSMVNKGRSNTNGSQFFIQLGDRELDFLNEKHTIFGHVAEGLHVIEMLNNSFVDSNHRPVRRFAIHHTSVIEDPFEDPPGLAPLLRNSPEPVIESDNEAYVSSGSESEDVDGDLLKELLSARQAKSHEVMLEMVDDIADADMVPPKNVLFVCRLNPLTEDQDLEMIFSRFGKVESCEILRARDGTSLQYAFVEFESVKSCEMAYIKMENVRIDDRRIHVDFSQSVPRFYCSWMKGEKGAVRMRRKDDDVGDQQVKRRKESSERQPYRRDRERSRDRERDGRVRDDRPPQRERRSRDSRHEDHHRRDRRYDSSRDKRR